MTSLLRFVSDETWGERPLSLLLGSLRGNGVLVLLGLVAVGVSPQVGENGKYSLNTAAGCVGAIIWKVVGSAYDSLENDPDGICPREVSKSGKRP